jgi:3-hydroxyacyl-[acyl-carrier-protein] dehydratase
MELNAEQLETLLPHRPPIVMLDRVIDLLPNESGTGIRAFRDGDTCFEGHFPELPILPGVLAIEAFAQTAMAVFLAEHANGEAPNKLGLLLKVNEMAFSEKIVPGRTVEFAIKVDRQVGPFAFVDCKATGEGKKFAIGKITLKIGN